MDPEVRTVTSVKTYASGEPDLKTVGQEIYDLLNRKPGKKG